MVADFSFGATVRVFGGAFVGAFAAFAGAFLFGGMARRRGFFGLEARWEMERRAGEMRRSGRDFGGEDVYFVVVWLTGGSHAQNFQPREAPARPIRALGEGAGTGLPALLLGSKNRRRCMGCAGVSPFSLPAPKKLSGAPVEML
jgi:hypothetical protein